MNDILELEQEIRFEQFDSDIAWAIAKRIKEEAAQISNQYCIDIRINDKQVFHFSSSICSPNHDKWLQRKINTVLEFHHSTKFMQEKLENNHRLLSDKYGLNISDYTLVEGGFPIILKDGNVIGAIAVSGLKASEDHAVLIKILKEFC